MASTTISACGREIDINWSYGLWGKQAAYRGVVAGGQHRDIGLRAWN